MSHLPADCINEIFEYLDEDKIALHSCLLVNRLWCKSAVRILWRNIWNFPYSRTYIPFAIISTLISCLPDESKDFLSKNGINISLPITKPPLFKYASFIKILSFSELDNIIQHVLENKNFITSLSLDYNKHLIAQEIIKMFMSQTSSLKRLEYYLNSCRVIPFNIHFACFPGARDCLKNLSELCCNSDVYPEFFYQLSQICRNLHSLTIEFQDFISNGLADFISLQNNLKSLNLSSYEKDWSNITPALKKISNTIIKLKIDVLESNAPTSFITSYTNLQELTLMGQTPFKELEYVIFSNLKILKFHFSNSRDEILMKFFENNGKNLEELNIDDIDLSLSSLIVHFCPNLKKISSIHMDNNGCVILKLIFNGCQHLESIKVSFYDYGLKEKKMLDYYLKEKEMLEIVSKYSQKNFYELKIYHGVPSNLQSKDLESFLMSWKNRIPFIPITLINIRDDSLNLPLIANEEIMRVIEQYKKLGIIQKFKVEVLFE
ncbi:hypothetical protein RclHR1_07160014 [Rhizophagus clarus]|uniref:F-box domain-containing protein n=1 Tax=Rhizophagus clarus TaxID=94130 RepID=A0A2Z6RVE1_9GLOM|nr:hypothetical protein RclHR1_07160014 [Rhizophagus clarus]GES72992.1 hypothetical protein GLOIN_2v1784405 [Rhizophagus clarus]